jgi:hypothetical protein
MLIVLKLVLGYFILLLKNNLGGSASEDGSMHLHNFCETCDMQIIKNLENDFVKLKLFPFLHRGKAKNGYYHYQLLASHPLRK